MKHVPLIFALSCTSLMLATSARADDPDKVEWSESWHRVHLFEGLDILGMAAGAEVINVAWPPPNHATWKGGILFDNAVRNVFVGHTYSLQNASEIMTDDFMLGSMVAPLFIDVYVVALGVHQNADVAEQLFIIDGQSLALTGILSVAAEHAIGRARPYVADCGPDGKVRSASGEVLLNSCAGNSFANYQSFFSGHSAITATMAGLTCIEHEHLPLYGGGAADLAPCLFMIALSATTGVFRLVADKHWASDVLIGWGIGTISGYILPAFMHFGFGHGRPIGEMHVAGATMVPMPEVYPGGGGLGLTGTW